MQDKKISRRRALNSAVSLTCISTGLSQISKGKKSTSDSVETDDNNFEGGGSSPLPYWERTDNDYDGVYVRPELVSTLNLQNIYTCENCSKIQFAFNSSSKGAYLVDYNRDGNFTTDITGVSYGEIKWEENGGNVALDFSTDKTRLGVRPKIPGGDDAIYKEFVKNSLGLAIGAFGVEYSIVYTAADSVAAFVNSATKEDGTPKSGKKFRFDWATDASENEESPEVDFHTVANATFTQGEAGSFIVSNVMWDSRNGLWVDNSWEVYFDGQNTGTKGIVGSSLNANANYGLNPAQESPNPPENPSEWTYHPVPQTIKEKKIPTYTLPKKHGARKFAENMGENHVIQTAAPVWTRKIDVDKSGPPQNKTY